MSAGGRISSEKPRGYGPAAGRRPGPWRAIIDRVKWRIPLPQDGAQRTLVLAIVTSVIFHLLLLGPLFVFPGLLLPPTYVKRGEPLFKLDERPVVALYGSLPLYRTLRVGVEGTDVKQFEKNLSKLGYTGFTVDDTYTAATALAARSWQADLGLPQTGAVEPGQLVVTPGAVRVAEHTARVGDRIGGDIGGGASVLSYTGRTRLVTVELAVADQALAAKSRTVTVTVPGQGPVKGKISQVGTVATAPEPTSNASGDQASNAPGGSSSTASDARIRVTVTIADQKKLGSLDAAPVDVDFVSEERKDVLAVPVAALLALPKGGYGVEIVEGGATRIVAVRTGMFAAGRVEISGDGIAEGVTVGVPK